LLEAARAEGTAGEFVENRIEANRVLSAPSRFLVSDSSADLSRTKQGRP
jgi:hypothetical protein